MSHYTEVKTTLGNAEYIIEALKALGFDADEIEYHKTPVHLYGYLDDMRGEVAEIVIRRENVGHSANDIGFKLQADGTYQAVISKFDSRSGGFNDTARECGGYNAKFLGRLTAEFAVIAAKTELEKKGCIVEVIKDENGKTRVVGKRRTIGGRVANLVEKTAKKAKKVVSLFG